MAIMENDIKINVSFEGITANDIKAAWEKYRQDAPYPMVFIMTEDGFTEAIRSLIQITEA
jgi:hypothetical protein